MSWKSFSKKILSLSFFFTSIIAKGQLPYQNPNLPSKQRAKDLVSHLTLEEKAELMLDPSPAIPPGIKKFNWWSEALHGLANNDNVSVFPEPIGMPASFNDSRCTKFLTRYRMKCGPVQCNAKRSVGVKLRAFGCKFSRTGLLLV